MMDWGILVHIMEKFTLNDGTNVTSYTEGGDYVTSKATSKPVRKGLYEVLGVEPGAAVAEAAAPSHDSSSAAYQPMETSYPLYEAGGTAAQAAPPSSASRCMWCNKPSTSCGLLVLDQSDGNYYCSSCWKKYDPRAWHYHFGGKSGMRRSGSGGEARQSRQAPKATPKPVRKRLYEVLGVEPTATAADIRRAYRKLAVVHHPDKGGDEELFREISAAYKTLSDEEKRKRYDAFGEADDDACDDFLSKFAEVFSSDLFSEFDIKITTQ